MKEQLIARLHQYIRDNNPDLLIFLQQEGVVTAYLQEKAEAIEPLLKQLHADETPAYITEQRCMDALTAELRPSRFNYLSAILEDEFELVFQSFKKNGILTYEIINLIEACQPVFNELGFTTANEDHPQLRNAITGAISQYLDNKPNL
jgi:hypothetical protein